ncbi:Nicotinate dehydrogenase large molybdopterin subunit [subsurface metagenome]
MIGKAIPRYDAWAKVKGELKYADDFSCALNLYVFRSKTSHAKIKLVDISKALKVLGVYSIITAKDIPGQNLADFKSKDQPLLADKIIRYKGEPIALIVAQNRDIAELAFKKIYLEFEILKEVLDPIEAMKSSSIKVHEEGNISTQITLEKGNIEKAFKEADVVIENQYRTSMCEHAYLTPPLDNSSHLLHSPRLLEQPLMEYQPRKDFLKLP